MVPLIDGKPPREGSGHEYTTRTPALQSGWQSGDFEHERKERVVIDRR